VLEREGEREGREREKRKRSRERHDRHCAPLPTLTPSPLQEIPLVFSHLFLFTLYTTLHAPKSTQKNKVSLF
jgi:hypothetical protein